MLSVLLKIFNTLALCIHSSVPEIYIEELYNAVYLTKSYYICIQGLLSP
jgi:hypothetical protein